MQVIVVLNRDGGTLKMIDIQAYAERISGLFEAAGHDVTHHIVSADNISDILETSAVEADAIVVGGGDGTISAAADVAWRSKTVLGVIPAGTMNLFARSLGLPLDIDQAAEVLANAKIAASDISTANGHSFVHQFSVGLQPKVIRVRDQLPFNSRFGKLFASARATLQTLVRPPSFPTKLIIDGAEHEETLSLVAVSNNPYGEGHMPYADRLDQGVLGVYRAGRLEAASAMKLTTDLMLGSWHTNPDFKMATAENVVLEFPKLKKKAQAVIDGELIKLEKRVELQLHPGALKVLVPDV